MIRKLLILLLLFGAIGCRSPFKKKRVYNIPHGEVRVVAQERCKVPGIPSTLYLMKYRTPEQIAQRNYPRICHHQQSTGP